MVTAMSAGLAASAALITSTLISCWRSGSIPAGAGVRAPGRVVQEREDRVVELQVPAAERVQPGDLGRVDGGDVRAELSPSGVGDVGRSTRKWAMLGEGMVIFGVAVRDGLGQEARSGRRRSASPGGPCR